MPYFSKQTYRFIEYTLVIGGSFYLGMFIYPFAPKSKNQVSAISLRTFAGQIDIATRQDIVLNTEELQITVKSKELRRWIESYVRNYSGQKDSRISMTLVNQYLESLGSELNTEPVNARFKFTDGRAEIFVPSVSGKKLNISMSAGLISTAITESRASVSLIFDKVEPEITLDRVNNLGITTLLGIGESNYGKSSLARISNIKVGMTKFNGIILKPGEEFSFNKLLGEVDDKHGYKAELVIKNGKLVREFGGGLCQVATTVFRAAILSGFEIKERKPHSFPVQYYNPQGFDATIYPGVVDLRFVNNTNMHALIQTRLIGSKLMVEVYGTSNGEKITMTGPVQYDKKPTGAMKAYFVRKFLKGDEIIKEERFNSVYKAPPANPIARNPLE